MRKRRLSKDDQWWLETMIIVRDRQLNSVKGEARYAAAREYGRELELAKARAYQHMSEERYEGIMFTFFALALLIRPIFYARRQPEVITFVFLFLGYRALKWWFAKSDLRRQCYEGDAWYRDRHRFERPEDDISD